MDLLVLNWFIEFETDSCLMLIFDVRDRSYFVNLVENLFERRLFWAFLRSFVKRTFEPVLDVGLSQQFENAGSTQVFFLILANNYEIAAVQDHWRQLLLENIHNNQRSPPPILIINKRPDLSEIFNKTSNSESPKSLSFKCPLPSIKTLSGLMSLWAISNLWGIPVLAQFPRYKTYTKLK